MSMQDPIADMLTRIRNAQAVGGIHVKFPSSKVKLAILDVFKNEGYVESYVVHSEGEKKNIEVTLRYHLEQPVIRKIKRISRSGCRVYRRSDQIPTVNSGLGVAVISTPQGVMTGRDAAAKKLGGEVLCTVE